MRLLLKPLSSENENKEKMSGWSVHLMVSVLLKVYLKFCENPLLFVNMILLWALIPFETSLCFNVIQINSMIEYDIKICIFCDKVKQLIGSLSLTLVVLLICVALLHVCTLIYVLDVYRFPYKHFLRHFPQVSLSKQQKYSSHSFDDNNDIPCMKERIKNNIKKLSPRNYNILKLQYQKKQEFAKFQSEKKMIQAKEANLSAGQVDHIIEVLPLTGYLQMDIKRN